MNQTPVISQFETKDLPETVRLYLETYNAAPWNYRWETVQVEHYLSDYINSPQFAGFVLTDDRGLAAALFCHRKTWWTGNSLYVDELFVSPSRQGKGLGRLLMQEAESYCLKAGLKNITLMTNKHMPAYDFYHKIEFLDAAQNVFLFKMI